MKYHLTAIRETFPTEISLMWLFLVNHDEMCSKVPEVSGSQQTSNITCWQYFSNSLGDLLTWLKKFKRFLVFSQRQVEAILSRTSGSQHVVVPFMEAPIISPELRHFAMRELPWHKVCMTISSIMGLYFLDTPAETKAGSSDVKDVQNNFMTSK